MRSLPVIQVESGTAGVGSGSWHAVRSPALPSGHRPIVIVSVPCRYERAATDASVKRKPSGPPGWPYLETVPIAWRRTLDQHRDRLGAPWRRSRSGCATRSTTVLEIADAANARLGLIRAQLRRLVHLRPPGPQRRTFRCIKAKTQCSWAFVIAELG